jgi:hypothetical protein
MNKVFYYSKSLIFDNIKNCLYNALVVLKVDVITKGSFEV